MSVWTVLWLVPWAAICCVWVGLLLAQFQVRRQSLVLAPDDGAGPDSASDDPLPSVCIVIPARNAASELRRCLPSILAQDYPCLEIVVVDDRSEDDTAGVVRQFTSGHPQLRLDRVESLPAGWLAKSHALWSATRAATAEWLLFIDSDCELDPRAVRTAVREALRRNVDFLTLWPRHRGGTFWEHMLIPLCGAIIALWFGSRHVNDPSRSAAFANGQFLLILREAYERIGGHRSVRSALIEDVPLAENARAAGLNGWVGSGSRIFGVRMYDSYAAIRDGWARIYVGVLRSGTRIALSMVWLLLGSLLPFVAAPILALKALSWGSPADTSPMFQAAVGLCLAHLILIFGVSYRFWGLGGCSRVQLWLYPVSVLVVIRILARAWVWLVWRRSVTWRRTHYAIDGRATIVGCRA